MRATGAGFPFPGGYVVIVDGRLYRPGQLISTEDVGDRPALRLEKYKR